MTAEALLLRGHTPTPAETETVFSLLGRILEDRGPGLRGWR